MILAPMWALIVMLALSCSKSENNDDKIVGGEDVTNPFLNPGGKLIDNGVNIVGAWAEVDAEGYFEDFIIVDSKGNYTSYRVNKKGHSRTDGFYLRSNGIIPGYYDDFEIGGMEGVDLDYPMKGGKTMLEVLFQWRQDWYREVFDLKNSWIDKKKGAFGLSLDDGGYDDTFEANLTNRNVDTYAITVVWKYDGESYSNTLYLRRIKGFLDLE